MSAKIIYKSYNQNENLLFLPSLGELIPKNHPVRTVCAIIDRLDISGIESTYKGGARAVSILVCFLKLSSIRICAMFTSGAGWSV